MPLALRTHQINHTTELYPYRASRIEAAGLRDIYSLYLPRGPIRKYVTYFRAGGGMPLYVGHSEYYDFDHVIRHIVGRPSLETGFKKGMFGGGKGHTLPGMAISGVAETFERAVGAFGFFTASDQIVYGTPRSMLNNGLRVLGPEELPIFAPEQFERHKRVGQLFKPYTEDSFLGWVEGARLRSGDKVWIPSQIALPLSIAHPQEDTVGYFTTGGLAAHINREEAIYHGLLELIERDAVNLRWNCRVPPERVRIDRAVDNVALRRLLDIGATLPAKFTFYLHSNDFEEVPVVTVIAYARGFKRYAYYAGGGVGFDIEESMLYALSEFGQSEGTLRALLFAPKWELAMATRSLFDVHENIEVDDIDLFFKIVSYYGYAKNFKKMRWYLEDGPEAPLATLPRSEEQSIEARYDAMLRLLEKHRLDPIVLDLSPQQMPQMKLVKVFCPELTPPYVQNMPLLGCRRYYELPEKMGWRDRVLTFADLNPDPQPYP